MKIALSWRALSESASHQSLVERLHRDYGHLVMVLMEPGAESIARSARATYQPVRTWFPWHPSLSVLTGWRESLEAFRPDVLLGLDEPYSLRSAVFLRWARRRSIPFVFLSCQNIDRLLPYPFRVLETWVLAHSQGAWFLNLEAAARARRRGYRGAGRVIPLGVQVPDPRSVEGVAACPKAGTIPAAEFTVGYAGRLVPEKGVEDLIRGCSLTGANLLVVGEGPGRERLETLARDLKVPSTWLGRIESTHMAEAYSRMDALVLPSVTTPRWKEQFGRVLVEAMAAGVPVVGTSSGEIPRVIGEAGLIFPERDPARLAECLTLIRTNPHLRTGMSLQGRRRVRNLYGWDQVTNHLNDLIHAVVCGDL